MELKVVKRFPQITKGKVSIAPLWNWKSVVGHVEQGTPRVSIAPLWNWKEELKAAEKRMYECFNRTFMELKDGMSDSRAWCPGVSIAPLWNWKYRGLATLVTPRQVSIAPLWNWKISTSLSYSCRVSFNRTFMELKAVRPSSETMAWQVSIAPLWNWKGSVAHPRRHLRRVSIAPLWNWKGSALLLSFLPHRFNRTFMELKDIPASWNVGAYWFQSHLYGIESWVLSFELGLGACFNRTFMELKVLTLTTTRLAFVFQSHLYGIER